MTMLWHQQPLWFPAAKSEGVSTCLTLSIVLPVHLS